MNDSTFINQVFSVTRDPLTHEYALVTKFKNEGDLRRLLCGNHTDLTWENAIYMLWRIGCGLRLIHRQGYHHKDFHSGNILNEMLDGGFIDSVISDFGLSRPVNEESLEDKKV